MRDTVQTARVLPLTDTEHLPDRVYLLCTLFALLRTLLCLGFREMGMLFYDHSSAMLLSQMHFDYIMCMRCQATPNEWAIAEQCWNV